MTDETIEAAKATQEVAKAAKKGLEVSEKLGGFFSNVFGLPIEQISGILSDRLKFMRWERLNRLIDRVNEINDKRKIAGKEIVVQPKLAIPCIENASYEETDELQDLWARLLSSAQNENTSDEIRTAYVDVIKQLEVIDVRLLNLLYVSFVRYKEKEGISHYISPAKVAFSKQEIIKAMKCTEREYEITLDNLIRLRCICSEVVSMASSVNIGGESPTIDRGYESICLTSFGLAFIKICVAE